MSCCASIYSAACSRSVSWASVSCDPANQYSMRWVSAPRARGSVQRAPGASSMIQTATSLSACAAQEAGGGGNGASAPGSAPATTVTVVAAPAASTCCRRGICSFQYMVKCAGSILWRAGRFSQIWNSCSGLGRSVCSSGNISVCCTPLPAVIHCTSPPPKRAMAPSESAWSSMPLRTRVMVSKPRCGCTGKPGTSWPWYMLQPSWALKSLPILRPASKAGSGPNAPLPWG